MIKIKTKSARNKTMAELYNLMKIREANVTPAESKRIMALAVSS